jgi:hypothetical protein
MSNDPHIKLPPVNMRLRGMSVSTTLPYYEVRVSERLLDLLAEVECSLDARDVAKHIIATQRFHTRTPDDTLSFYRVDGYGDLAFLRRGFALWMGCADENPSDKELPTRSEPLPVKAAEPLMGSNVSLRPVESDESDDQRDPSAPEAPTATASPPIEDVGPETRQDAMHYRHIEKMQAMAYAHELNRMNVRIAAAHDKHRRRMERNKAAADLLVTLRQMDLQDRMLRFEQEESLAADARSAAREANSRATAPPAGPGRKSKRR